MSGGILPTKLLYSDKGELVAPIGGGVVGCVYRGWSVDRLLYNQSAHSWIEILLVPAKLAKIWSMYGQLNVHL